MREIRQSGSEGGEAEINRPSLPLSREDLAAYNARRLLCRKCQVTTFIQ
jgi:hypothetical protein